jgi:hypothetical protein
MNGHVHKINDLTYKSMNVHAFKIYDLTHKSMNIHVHIFKIYDLTHKSMNVLCVKSLILCTRPFIDLCVKS